MKNKIQNPFSDDNCFFCGEKNTFGLKLKFFWHEKKKEASTEYIPLRHFSGQGTILHGGIQMGLLDEIMGWTSYVHTKEMSVTSELNLKFLHPAYIDGKKILVTCRVLSQDGPKVYLLATLSNHLGVTCTRAEGCCHVLSENKYTSLIRGRQNENKKNRPQPVKGTIEWASGPDRDMNWHEACEWVKTLSAHEEGWQMPLIDELKTLYNQNSLGPKNIHESLKTSGWWLWSAQKDGPLSALGFDIVQGKAVSGGRSLVSGGRVFAVRTRK